MSLVRSRANSLLELGRYDNLRVLGELVGQTYPGRRLTYWDARLKTIHTLSEAIDECKELGRKEYAEKNLLCTALAQKKTCFAYYCPRLNYFFSGVWRGAQVISLASASEGWFVIQRWFSPQPKPLTPPFALGRATTYHLGGGRGRQLFCRLLPNSITEEWTFTPPGTVTVCCPRKSKQIARYNELYAFGDLARRRAWAHGEWTSACSDYLSRP